MTHKFKFIFFWRYK